MHAALDHPGGGVRGGEGSLIPFVEKNVVGTLQLIEARRTAGVARFVFISTCAVHEKILDDRPLDERIPCGPRTTTEPIKRHREVCSQLRTGSRFSDCALRPTGIYGAAHPITDRQVVTTWCSAWCGGETVVWAAAKRGARRRCRPRSLALLAIAPEVHDRRSVQLL